MIAARQVASSYGLQGVRLKSDGWEDVTTVGYISHPGIKPTTSSPMGTASLPQHSYRPLSSFVGLIAGALFPRRLGAVSGTINPCVLPVGPGSDWWFGLTWLFLLIDRAPTLLLPVHPHLVSRTHDLAIHLRAPAGV